MDILQFQTLLEKILETIISQSPDAIDKLKNILELIADGSHAIGAIDLLIAKCPVLIELANQLLALLNTGATIHQIAVISVQLASTLGLSFEAVIQLLQIIGGMLVIF